MGLTGQRLRARLGVLLRQGRDEAGLTQEAAARRLRGVTTARTLPKWELGKGNLKPLHYAIWLARSSDTLRKGLVFLMQPDSDQRGVGGKVADALIEADIATATLEERYRAAKQTARRSTGHAAHEKARGRESANRREAESQSERIRRRAEISSLARRAGRGDHAALTTLENLIDPFLWVRDYAIPQHANGGHGPTS